MQCSQPSSLLTAWERPPSLCRGVVRSHHQQHNSRRHVASKQAATTSKPVELPPHTQQRSGGKRVAVVGGGIGGLLVAGRLAQEGHQVIVLEQNQEVGGRCQSVTTPEGFRFDTGPSLLLLPQAYHAAFESLGARLEDHVSLARVEPAAYRTWFPAQAGGCTTLELLYDVQAMVQQLESIETGGGANYLAWLSDARAALEVGTANFIARDFSSGLAGVAQFLDPGRLLPLLGRVNVAELLGQHHARLARRFKDPRIRALLSFQDLYVGLSPYSAPGVFSLLAATEITDGVWYPLGGFGTVRDGLARLATSHGASLHTGARVIRIATKADKVVGVELASGDIVEADLVVTNRDVPESYALLDDSPHASKQLQRLTKLDYSAGVISFNWCLNTRLDALAHHNVFMSDEWERSWARARQPSDVLPRPNFYVHCPSRTDPSAAPPGCDSVMVLLPVANIQERGGDGDYAALVDAGRAAVLATLQAAGVGDVSKNIIHESVIDPQEWARRYGVHHGAAFGLSHGLTQLALLRPAVKDEALQGLYFTGASTRPGNGVPLVMMGAELTVQRILGDIKAAVC